MKDLKKELQEKIHHVFSNNNAYLSYLVQTKKSFLARYLETSLDKNIMIDTPDDKTFIAFSFESNMGEAFKIHDSEIKEGIKHLAKSIARDQNPKVRYCLRTDIQELKGEHGKIIITAQVHWDFPLYEKKLGFFKEKSVSFEFHEPTIFRKNLALKYEEACDLFN